MLLPFVETNVFPCPPGVVVQLADKLQFIFPWEANFPRFYTRFFIPSYVVRNICWRFHSWTWFSICEVAACVKIANKQLEANFCPELYIYRRAVELTLTERADWWTGIYPTGNWRSIWQNFINGTGHRCWESLLPPSRSVKYFISVETADPDVFASKVDVESNLFKIAFVLRLTVFANFAEYPASFSLISHLIPFDRTIRKKQVYTKTWKVETNTRELRLDSIVATPISPRDARDKGRSVKDRDARATRHQRGTIEHVTRIAAESTNTLHVAASVDIRDCLRLISIGNLPRNPARLARSLERGKKKERENLAIGARKASCVGNRGRPRR